MKTFTDTWLLTTSSQVSFNLQKKTTSSAHVFFPCRCLMTQLHGSCGILKFHKTFNASGCLTVKFMSCFLSAFC